MTLQKSFEDDIVLKDEAQKQPLAVNTPPDHSSSFMSDSPLWMLTDEPILDELVQQLQDVRQELMEDETVPREVIFSRSQVEAARMAFSRVILQGEKRLHRLCQLFCETFFTTHQLQSIVIGELVTTRERFSLTQSILSDDLYSTIDLDLGSRQLQKLKFHDGSRWSRARLIANEVEYQSLEPNRFNIHKITSRIKAEEEVWNKVVDEIFDLDKIVARDKELRFLSRYVKDIFGIKIVVSEVANIYEVHEFLFNLSWPTEVLLEFDIEPNLRTQHLEFLETKDYLKQEHHKLSGWEAIKSVVGWADKTFEIQVQSLRNFMRERQFLTEESHTSFKSNREQVREQVAQQIPLFGFYRELLRWLFLAPDDFPPRYPGVTVRLRD